MPGSFDRGGGSIRQWALITDHMLFHHHSPTCRYMYELRYGRRVVWWYRVIETKGRIGPWPILGPPFIPPQDGEHCGNGSAWRAIYSVRNILFCSSLFLLFSSVVGNYSSMTNLSPNRNVENYKTASGSDEWVQFGH